VTDFGIFAMFPDTIPLFPALLYVTRFGGSPATSPETDCPAVEFVWV